MEKSVVRLGYWLGLVCAVIAIVVRGVNLLAVWLASPPMQARTGWYMSFYKGALLLFLAAIAAANFSWSEGRK